MNGMYSMVKIAADEEQRSWLANAAQWAPTALGGIAGAGLGSMRGEGFWRRLRNIMLGAGTGAGAGLAYQYREPIMGAGQQAWGHARDAYGAVRDPIRDAYGSVRDTIRDWLPRREAAPIYPVAYRQLIDNINRVLQHESWDRGLYPGRVEALLSVLGNPERVEALRSVLDRVTPQHGPLRGNIP